MMGEIRGNMKFFFSMIMIMIVSGGSSVCAFSLDLSNIQGSPGSQYWDITAPGTYELNITANMFSTNHNYAIRIFASNVIFDGKDKTITGTIIGTSEETGPSHYGIRVNSGSSTAPTVNVTVKNVTVLNKYYGVIYEWVQGGAIQDSHFTSNGTGIYTWKSSNLNIRSNTVNSNKTDGIVLDAHQSTNDYFTIDSNTVYANVNNGIMLWFSNNHNTITNNQVYGNNMGIVLTDGQTGAEGTDNTISGNTIYGNVNGIYLSNYHGSSITGNSLSDNTNVGVWLLGSSSGNQFTGNTVQTSGWRGMYLEGSANGNTFYNNVFKNSHPLNPDENYGSDGTVYNNQWYTTPTPGVNIVGGPTIGGNYWSNASSTGFSDTQPDTNNDGFCDQQYNPKSDLIDRYPLHKTAVFNVTPNSLSFGYVPVGSTKDLSLTVKNTGVGTLSGNATTAAPFSIVSGGSYSLSSGQSQIVMIRYQPTSAGEHTGTVVFTGGSGATVPVTGKTERPRSLPGLLLLLLGN